MFIIRLGRSTARAATAATIVCELGRPLPLPNSAAVNGLVWVGIARAFQWRPHSTGAITKTGNAHLRRVLVEAAWAYQHRPNVTGFLFRRQKSLALSDAVKHIALPSVRGPRQEQESDVTALGGELLGFLWAIAVHTEAQLRLPRGSLTSDVFMDSSADDSAGPTKRSTLLTFYAEPVPGPNPRV